MLRKFNIRLLGNTSIRYSSSNSSNQSNDDNPELIESFNLNAYQKVSDEFLENLCDTLEPILEDRFDKGADVRLDNGVLTASVDNENTYVINKQTPNRQIWLSSPISGPKRFDYVANEWIDTRTKVELRRFLSDELSHLLKTKIEC